MNQTTDLTRVALMGMPSTGKTTYLAALYHQLCDPPSGASARLALQPSTRAYLERIRSQWLIGDPVDRAVRDSGEFVELDVATSNGRVLLQIPDVAGETYETAFAKRQIDQEIADSVVTAAGLLVLTTGDQLRPRTLLTDAAARMALDDGVDHAEKPFDHSRVPGEVQLVDLLQWVVDVRDDGVIRCAVVISAWDRMPDKVSPGAWVESQMPMLHRFLVGQEKRISAAIFGLSAQGGDYGTDNPASREPHDRAYVVTAAGERTNDLWLPVDWSVST